MDELLPLSAYHRQSDELLDRQTRWGSLIAAAMTAGAFLLYRSDPLSLGVVLGSVGAGIAAYVVWVVFWGGTMKRLHRWQATRVYEEESRIAPKAPDGSYSLRLPMCADLSSRSKATGGTLFVSPDRLTFVPNRDKKGAPSVTIPTADVTVEVREWLDAPRALRRLRHRHSILDVIGPDERHSFLTVEAQAVADALRYVLPGVRESSSIRAEDDEDVRRIT